MQVVWDRRTPQEWRALIKKVACYAHGLGPRLYAANLKYRHSGTEIAIIALRRVREQRTGYVFRDGHVLYYYFLCAACLRTAEALQRAAVGTPDPSALDRAEEDDTPMELGESVAVAFLERRKCLDAFLAFIKEKRLKGKQRAYSQGFPKYAAEGWDAECIARDLRISAADVGKYRSQLRGFLEDFEIERERGGKSTTGI